MADSANAVAQRWAQRMAQSTDAYKRGIQSVQVSPTELAAQNADGYLAGVQEAVNSGKFQAALRRVSNAAWQQAAIVKGAPRLATGASAAQPKVESYLNEALPMIEQFRSRVKQMPGRTREERMQRSLEFQRLMGEWGDRRRTT